MAILLDNLQQQIDEIEALEAVYGTDALVLAAGEQEALGLARLLVSQGVEADQLDRGALGISGILRLPDAVLMGAPVGLQFALSQSYPSQAKPQLSIECCAPRHTHERLTNTVKQCAERAAAMECCLLLAAEALKDEVQQVLSEQARDGDTAQTSAADATASTHVAPSNGAGNNADSSPNCNPSTSDHSHILRVSIWFHHIKSLEKRKTIVATARALGVRGACKPGFPGVIVCEGAEDDVRSFVADVRALSWQAMQVRAEELVVMDAQQRQSWRQQRQQQGLDQQQGLADAAGADCLGFKGLFQELPESGMSELGQLCRDAGAEQLFLAALKL